MARCFSIVKNGFFVKKFRCEINSVCLICVKFISLEYKKYINCEK